MAHSEPNASEDRFAVTGSHEQKLFIEARAACFLEKTTLETWLTGGRQQYRRWLER